MAKRKVVDWDSMREDWRVGLKSVLKLSKEHSVSRAAILKHWKKEGVERDLTARIKAKADSLVTRSLVTPEVTLEQTVTDNKLVEVNAENSANIQIHERADVTSARNLTQKLFKELEAQTEELDAFEQLGELLDSPDEKGIDKLNDLYRKVIAFPGRVRAIKDLTDAMRIQIELERKVYKIDGIETTGSIEDFIRANRASV